MSLRLRNLLCLAACCVGLGACDHSTAEVTRAPTPGLEADTCARAGGFAQSWTPERRAALEQGFAEIPGEWPAQLLEAVDTHFVAREPAWRAAYVEACERDWEHKDEATLRCLERELWELEAALTLSEDDADWAARLWMQLDPSARPFASCAGESLAPLSPELGREWAALSLERRGLVGEARAQALAARLEKIPLEGVLDDSAYAFELRAAEAIMADAQGARTERDAALGELRVIAQRLEPARELERLWLRAELDVESPIESARVAMAAARELGEPDLLLVSLDAFGRAQSRARDYEAALAPLTEAIAVATRLAGSGSPYVAQIQLTLAEVLTARGKIEPASDLLTQARDSLVAELGPDHPSTLASVEAIGALFMAAGQPGDAQYAYLDLLDVYDQLYGAKDWRVAKVKLELGDSLMAMEQFRGARTMYVEALTPIVQALGADSRAAIRTSIHLGIAALKLELLEEAEEHCGRGVNLVKALASDDPLAGEVEQCVTELAAARKRGDF